MYKRDSDFTDAGIMLCKTVIYIIIGSAAVLMLIHVL